MNPRIQRPIRSRQRGQTIIIAMIVLGLLLILGFVFLGIINQSIRQGRNAQTRSEATGLAQAGIEYAHSQLLTSPLGADWRGDLTGPVANGDGTSDPDAFYLRPPATNGANVLTNPDTGAADLGGPDGLGPFFRVNFDNGRALVRVRYAPSDANLFSNSPTGPLRNPGVTRNYLIIESVGRQGAVNPNDPTTLAGPTVQFRNFGGQGAFNAAYAQMKKGEGSFTNNRRLTAMVSLGLTDNALFITNIHKVTRAAELGIPPELGVTYPVGLANVANVASQLSLQIGTPSLAVPSGSGASIATAGLGSVYCNADLQLYGNVTAYENQSLGDKFDVAGSISSYNNADFKLARASLTKSPFNWTVDNFDLGAIDSQASTFVTANVVQDGLPILGSDGGPRGVGRKEPPSISATDPNTGLNRYVEMTRDSGTLVNGVSSGQFGYGSGVYVDNVSDVQTPRNEAGRQNVGENQSLVYDWLNPNNGGSRSGWEGPFYVPFGTFVALQTDGWTITRDGRAPNAERFWRMPDGTTTSASTIRYRVGYAGDNQVHVVNSFTPGVSNINGALTSNDYAKGPVFNGVLYFEGNVRVRGIIPTDLQLTLVSNATIYIEGSITRGVTGNDLTAGVSATQRLNRPSRSMLGLLAKDYVAVNTTMFFGPAGNQTIQAVQDVPSNVGYNPIRLLANNDGNQGTLDLLSEFVLDPNTGTLPTPYNPSNWRPYAADYTDSVNTGNKLPTRLLLTHATDEGAGGGSVVALDVNPGVAVSAYNFPRTSTNLAASIVPTTNPLVDYGLGGETWQKYPKFESLGFTVVDPTLQNVSGSNPAQIVFNSSTGVNNYALASEDTNDLRIHTDGTIAVPGGQNDYLLARAALAPHDIRIEATIYAQEGSFFVIPGPWFNPNPDDRRDTYLSQIQSLTTQGYSADQAKAIADDQRLSSFGTSPEIPFYGEPLDVKINIVGSVSENMPPSMSQQAEWLRKWGWIPAQHGATTEYVPISHLPSAGFNVAQNPVVPNITISYDPVLATARTQGFNPTQLGDPQSYVRTQWIDFNGDGNVEANELLPLPPLPRLPVSPALSYFGDVQ